MAGGFSQMGRRPEKSSFSLTCNLLSQYIKEKGCPPDIGFEMPARALEPAAIGKPEAYRVPTTMSLLSGVNGVGDERAGVKDDALARSAARSMEFFPSSTASCHSFNQPENAQLTIFYRGKVLVFDNFPTDKADELVKLASKGSSPASGNQNISFAPHTAAADHPFCPSPANTPSPASFPSRPPPKSSDLPIARKASLHRFLEKRKDRIHAKAPYQLSSIEEPKGAVSLKGEINQPWLVLGPQILNSSR